MNFYLSRCRKGCTGCGSCAACCPTAVTCMNDLQERLRSLMQGLDGILAKSKVHGFIELRALLKMLKTCFHQQGAFGFNYMKKLQLPAWILKLLCSISWFGEPLSEFYPVKDTWFHQLD